MPATHPLTAVLQGVASKPDPALLTALRHLVSTDLSSLTNKKGKVTPLPVLIDDAGRPVVQPDFSVCHTDVRLISRHSSAP